MLIISILIQVKMKSFGWTLNIAYGRKLFLFCLQGPLPSKPNTTQQSYHIKYKDIIEMKDFFFFCSSNAILVWRMAMRAMEMVELNLYNVKYIPPFDDEDKFWNDASDYSWAIYLRKFSQIGNYVTAIFRIAFFYIASHSWVWCISIYLFSQNLIRIQSMAMTVIVIFV